LPDAKVTVVFDFKKLRKDIERETGLEAKKALKSLTQSELRAIGLAVCDEIRTVTAKGISPIKSIGRFQPYKWAAKKSLKRKSGSSGKSLNREFQNKYPYSVRDKYPDKRERPVNLRLSGEFIKSLTAKVVSGVLSIGYFNEQFAKYESGHREGVNGQPKRPTIPQNSEQFSDTIYRRLVKVIQSVFDKKK
jgi:hypothetical protein